MLEQEAIPLYYQREFDGIPRGWLQLMKESLRTNAPRFCTKRMVKEYVDTMYAPAMVLAPSIW
jgi:starch phosphorylase